jgi:hypothetical protein
MTKSPIPLRVSRIASLSTARQAAPAEETKSVPQAPRSAGRAASPRRGRNDARTGDVPMAEYDNLYKTFNPDLP